MFTTTRQGCDQWGHQWMAAHTYRYALSLKTIADRLLHPLPQMILDIGCGMGDFTEIVRAVNPSNRLFGIDIAQNAITPATARFPEIEFRRSSFPEIEFEKRFDGIIALECIYYLDTKGRRATLANIAEHLKSGGWLLFSSRLDDGTRYFSVQQAVIYIRQAGFEIRQITYNFARIYSTLTSPLDTILRLNRILQTIEDDPAEATTPIKRSLYKMSRSLFWGFLLKKGTTYLAAISEKILKSMQFVKACQFLGRIWLCKWSRSHIIIVAEKKP